MTPLRFIIVGGGLGGLAAAYCLGRAGHNVLVFESASRIGDVGAAIQVSPNLSRLLIKWGLGEDLRKASVKPRAITFRRYTSFETQSDETGHRVGWTKWGETMDRDYGAPYYHVHRADLLDMLFKLSSPYMTLFLKSRVVSLDPDFCQVTLESGQKFRADVILGADGVKSMVRAVVVGGPDRPMRTGDAAYRAIIPTSEMRKDSDLKPLVDHPEMTGWIGPGRHIMGYCIRGGLEYNLVLLHPDRGSSGEAYDMPGSVQRMKADFEGWEPRVQKLLELVSTTLIWPLFDRDPLARWGPSSRKNWHCWATRATQCSHIVLKELLWLLKMPPSSASLFSHVTSRHQIQPLLHAYQVLRHSRTTRTQLEARQNQTIFHLPDGREQAARDQSMREGMEDALRQEQGEPSIYGSAGNANVWADRTKNRIQFLYDAEEAA
ncbi:hypothetical protein B0H14DRAFT_3619858 [Mycena olivaceomarginata]|nr:hypothetical protein B0H14DRAFT_3619858 [Mycena olivaceomarginata]